MKNKIKKISKILLVILLLIVLQVVGYTYAKYISSEKAIGEAEIAKWSFKLVKDGEEIKKIKLVNTTDPGTLVNGKIAPGSSGAIQLKLDASGSEVSLDYTIQFGNEQNKPKNLYFIYMGKEYSSLSEIGIIRGTINYNANKDPINVAVLWKWDYEKGENNEEKVANDKIDTEDANKIAKYTFDAVVTGTQSEKKK